MIKTGQIYEQKEFPNHDFKVIMLGSMDGELQYCRVTLRDPSFAVTEMNGKFLYSKRELIELIERLKYTLRKNQDA